MKTHTVECQLSGFQLSGKRRQPDIENGYWQEEKSGAKH